MAFSFLALSALLTTYIQLSESSTADLGSSNIPETFESKEVSNGSYSGRCVLPLVPSPDASVRPGDGVRFGNTPRSRQEIPKDPEFLMGMMHDTIVSMEFKSTGESGVLFHVSAGCDRIDNIGLFMRGGRIVYVFDCGSGAAVIASSNAYNDGQWHRVVILRHSQEGRMLIDDTEAVRGVSPGYYTRVDQQKSPLYVGGLPEEAARKSKHSLQGVVSSFPGCIRNVEVQGELLTTDTRSVMTDVCSDQVEEGAFFSNAGGHLVIYDKYYVGHWSSISMDIKPRHLSGILMSIHSKQDYLMLQLIDGRVQFTMATSNGRFTATNTPGHQLCDGQFHTIRVLKSNNTITVTVDHKSSEPGTGIVGKSSIETFDPLHVGGVPKESLNKRGVETEDRFVGCIRKFEIDEHPLSMAEARVIGQVTLTCPTV